MRMVGCVAIWAMALSMAGAAYAAEPTEGRGAPTNFILVGVGVAPDFLGSDHYVTLPYAAGFFFTPYADIAIIGPTARVDLLAPQTGRRFLAGPTFTYRFGRDGSESAAVDRLPDVDPSVEVGGFVGFRIGGLLDRRDGLTLNLDVAADVADGHGGYTLQPSVRYNARIGERIGASLGVSAVYASGSFMRSFFDVTPTGSVASGLAVFDADPGFYRIGANAGVTYDLTESFGLFGQAWVARLIGDAQDSPVVAREGDAFQVLGAAGLTYRF